VIQHRLQRARGQRRGGYSDGFYIGKTSRRRTLICYLKPVHETPLRGFIKSVSDNIPTSPTSLIDVIQLTPSSRVALPSSGLPTVVRIELTLKKSDVVRANNINLGNLLNIDTAKLFDHHLRFVHARPRWAKRYARHPLDRFLRDGIVARRWLQSQPSLR
jgi:hypothetical protein